MSARAFLTRRWVAIAAILALALVVRVVAIAADSDYVPENDAFDYHRHAGSIVAGEGYPEALLGVVGGPSAFRPPGYPFFLAGVYELTGGLEKAPGLEPPTAHDLPTYEAQWTAGRIANALLGVVAVLLIYLIAHRLWGRAVGLVAATIAAVFPPLFFLSTELLSESLFMALELGALLAALILRRDPGRLRWALIAGVLVGLATLTRPNGVLLLPLLAAGVWVARPRMSLDAIAAPVLLVVAVVLTIAPWTARNYVATGRFIPVTTQLGFSLAGTYNEVSLNDSAHDAAWRVPIGVPPYTSLLGVPGIDEPAVHSVMEDRAREFALDHPGYLAEASFRNLMRTFDLAGGGVIGAHGTVEERGVGVSASSSEPIALWVVLALGLVGIAALMGWLRRPASGQGETLRWNPGPLFMWLIPVAMIVAAIPIIGLPRYRAPADPFFIMLAAVGAVAIWDLIRERRSAAGTGEIGAREKAAAHAGGAPREPEARPLP